MKYNLKIPAPKNNKKNNRKGLLNLFKDVFTSFKRKAERRTEKKKETPVTQRTKETKQTQKAQPNVDYKDRELANKLNEALDIASEIQKNFPHGNGEYAKYLEPLMKYLTGYGTDEDNEYFTVYQDRNKNFLYEDVRFNELPSEDEKVQQYVDKILDLDWSSYENYADKFLEIKNSIYESNIASDEDVEWTIDDYDMVNVLEDIMNTSAAWHIASRNAPDSDQVKSNWVELFNIASDAQKWGLGDNIRQLIRNEVSLEEIDKQIYKAIKEK